MKTTLSPESIADLTRDLKTGLRAFEHAYPGETAGRQPVHTVYGGAHLFTGDTVRKLGVLAKRSLETYAPSDAILAEVLGLSQPLAATVYQRIVEKLDREPIEDYRIDFEDGYGIRPDEEEDRDASAAAVEMAKGLDDGNLAPFTGIRIKTFSEEQLARAVRTLDIFLSTLVEATHGRLPENFVVTLPKVTIPSQVTALVGVFEALEYRLKLADGSLKMEIMVETTQSIIDQHGQITMPKLVAAAKGRCTGAHFGAYDYTASCNITAPYQDMLHPACDFARHMMQVSLAGTGVRLSDGATNVMPIGPHRGDLTPEQESENREVVHRAWRLHYDHVRHSLANGFYQGWDLHPAQIPTRYAAVYAFFLEGLDATSARLKNFIEKAARATLVGDVFDDAATGQGLLNYFVRAVNCGAMTSDEAEAATGLTRAQLAGGSFKNIIGA